MPRPAPLTAGRALAMSLVCDAVPGVRNSLRTTCKHLREAVPAAAERLDDADLTPSFVRWVMDGRDPDGAEAAAVGLALVRSGRTDTMEALDTPLDHDMVQEAVRRGRADVLRWLRTRYAHWTDEGALAQCLRWSRFELIEAMGLSVTSSAYIHAAATNNVEAVDWLARMRVPAPHNLASFAASYGHVEAMERILEMGVGGCEKVAFKTACNRRKVSALEALWRRGQFDNYVFSAALKTGDEELMAWGRSKRPVVVDVRHIVECLVHVIKRDDLAAYMHLYKASPYHCLAAPMLDGVDAYGAARIARFLRTQYGPQT